MRWGGVIKPALLFDLCFAYVGLLLNLFHDVLDAMLCKSTCILSDSLQARLWKFTLAGFKPDPQPSVVSMMRLSTMLIIRCGMGECIDVHAGNKQKLEH